MMLIKGDLFELSEELSVLGDRTGLSSKQLYQLKKTLTYGGIFGIRSFIQKQISRGYISSKFGNKLLELCNSLNLNDLRQLIDLLITNFDFVKIEPFVKEYDEFKSALQKKLGKSVVLFNAHMERETRIIELKLEHRSKIRFSEVADLAERFYEEKQKARYNLSEYYLRPKKRLKTIIRIL